MKLGVFSNNKAILYLALSFSKESTGLGGRGPEACTPPSCCPGSYDLQHKGKCVNTGFTAPTNTHNKHGEFHTDINISHAPNFLKSCSWLLQDLLRTKTISQPQDLKSSRLS